MHCSYTLLLKYIFIKDVVSPDEHGNFACEVFGSLIVSDEIAHYDVTIMVKYCTSQAKLLCPVRRSDIFSVHHFSNVII